MSSIVASRPLLPTPPLVGRSAERAELLASLDRAAAREPQTVLVTGESGVGKTRLVHEVAREARVRGFAVAEGRAFAVESGLPYAVFADALLPLLGSLEPTALTVLTRGAGADLAGIFPSLFPAGRGGAGSPEESKVRMYWSFTELLFRLAARRPLLLVLDNLQWADPSSLELLHFVARQARAAPGGAALAILATSVDAAHERRAGVRAMEQSLVELGVARVLRLGALTAEQTRELVQRLFDVPAPVVHEFAGALHEWTGGNAFFIEESLTSLVESGQLHRAAAGWSGWDLRALTPARSVREVVLDRAARLPAAARTLLDTGAVLGTRMTLPVLRAVVALDDAALAGALDDLERAALFVSHHDAMPSWDFVHPLVRDTIHGALGPVRAQGMHDRIAAALETLYAGDAERHAAELAHHLTRGSGGAAGERAAGYLAEAGRQALARHADRAAVEYLEAALSYCGTAREGDPACASTDLLESLAHARQRVGDFAGSAAFWHIVRARAIAEGDPRRAAITERRLGLMASATGDPAGAVAHFSAGLAALGEGDAEPALATRLRLARAHALQAMARHAEALVDASDALRAADALGDDALLARVHRTLLLLHVWTGPSAQALDHGREAVRRASASGERSVEWSAHWAMAVHAGLTGDGPATAHHVREARRLADEVRSPVLRLWTADVAIEYFAGIGDWRAALALSDEAIPAARALGQRTLLPRLLVWTGLVHRGLGDLERARVLVEEAWALAGAGPAAEAAGGPGGGADVHALVPAYTGMAGYLMTAGENARALAVGEAGLAIADRAGHVAWAIYRLLPFVIESALYLEDYERAARHNARLRRDSLALGHPLGLAWADTTDALLVYLGGDAARAVPMLRAATATLEQVPFVFDAAKLRRLVARALLDAGDEEGAAAELRKAHEIFARLGAQREMRLTREQMRGIGARVPAARRPSADAVLSARELEIARLVAARKSNKEIGAALDISSRTVSTHLSNIFEKLGVASRGELTDLVRQGRLGGAPL